MRLNAGSLLTLDNMKLLNRRDRKYIFSIDILPDLLGELSDNYYVLEIGNNREFSYSNVYFDTNDYKFYTNHHNGKKNRYKVRYRHYIESDAHFVEIKFKSNKNKTFKERFETQGFEQQISGNADKVIKQIGLGTDEISPKVRIEYSRITFFHKERNEKVTIDRNIAFFVNTKKYTFPQLVIAEVKRNTKCSSDGFVALAKRLSIRPIRISKYCIAMACGYNNIKYNRFKPKLLKIEGLNNGFSLRNRKF